MGRAACHTHSWRFRRPSGEGGSADGARPARVSGRFAARRLAGRQTANARRQRRQSTGGRTVERQRHLREAATQQAKPRHRLEDRCRPANVSGTGGRCRRGDRELQRPRHASAGLRLRKTRRRQSQHHLRGDARLRQERPVSGSSGIRADGGADVRLDDGDGLRNGRTAQHGNGVDGSDLRSQRRRHRRRCGETTAAYRRGCLRGNVPA